MVMRQIVLDTETTGLSYAQGHRIIEIGCIEILDRQITDNHYHQYINPEREVDAGALQIHGLDNAFLADYPVFKDVIQSFHDFIQDDFSQEKHSLAVEKSQRELILKDV